MSITVAIFTRLLYNKFVMGRKTLYFDSFCGYYISAVTENEKITEFNFEKRENKIVVGNIYKGRVEKVLPGMNAAFVDCGLSKNCYLCADEHLAERDKYDIESDLSVPVLPELHAGDEILVQVVKLPVGKKGAKVTSHITIVGKSIIYMPDTPFIGVSRKISDGELRKNLIYSAQKLISEGEGLVLRTAAPYASRRQLEEEYAYLKNLYEGISAAAPAAPVGQLMYADFALPIRVLRDTLSSDIDRIVVGSRELAKMLENIVSLYPSHSRRPVELHETGRDMMDELGLSSQFLGITSPRVDLENGAYLVIEHTEALTVIDVNTGHFTGDDNLEQTVYLTNILAAREIARQVRLRNIGGIIVVDFIDMQETAHKNAIVEELDTALKGDKVKCSVSPMSRLGLVEFTRKRTGVSIYSMMVKPCRRCNSGYVRTAEFIIIGLRANLLNMFVEGAGDIRIDVNNEVFSRLMAWKEMREDLNAHAKGAKIYAVPHRTYREEQITVRTAPFNIPYDAVEI